MRKRMTKVKEDKDDDGNDNDNCDNSNDDDGDDDENPYNKGDDLPRGCPNDRRGGGWPRWLMLYAEPSPSVF
jgi:hypothetical protein